MPARNKNKLHFEILILVVPPAKPQLTGTTGQLYCNNEDAIWKKDVVANFEMITR